MLEALIALDGGSATQPQPQPLEPTELLTLESFTSQVILHPICDGIIEHVEHVDRTVRFGIFSPKAPY